MKWGSKIWRWIVLFVIIVSLTLAFAGPAWASAGEGGIGGKALALFIAGLFSPYLTQVLKKWFGGLEAKPALWIAILVSLGISALSLIVTGELGWTAPPTGDPVAAIGWFMEAWGTVFALATLVYKFFISPPE